MHALSIPWNAQTDLRWGRMGKITLEANFGYYEVFVQVPGTWL